MPVSSGVLGIVNDLRTQLDRHYPSWQVGNIRPEAAGLEFLVCRGDSSTRGPFAFRVPWRRRIANENDESIDARDLLRQEAFLASHAKAFGVASPSVRHLHIGEDGFDFLASEFVIHDGSPPDSRQFGQLVRTIHDVPLPGRELVMQGDIEVGDLIANRLLRRSRAVERIGSIKLPLPRLEELRAVLAQVGYKPSLLHMDARAENVLTWRGSIRGIVDWSNALVGSPALELDRIAEYGQVNEEFLFGYGNSGHAEAPRREELIYRLDTAVMLALVFLSESPDAVRARSQIARAVSLFEEFRSLTR